MTRGRALARQVGEARDESEWGDLVGLWGEVMEVVWSGPPGWRADYCAAADWYGTS
jgi:hypothetical protein